MTPAEVGKSYDLIADQWRDPAHPLTGIPQHQQALKFLTRRGHALDVGCGCNGRLIDLLIDSGFTVSGIHVSQRMIELARERHSNVQFFHADITQWRLPRSYDFISAWDSIWHVPLQEQKAVLRKLCDGLTEQGILIFTLGGTDYPAESRDTHMGVPMYTATLGIPRTLALLAECGCSCRHLQYDQLPQLHAYIIAQKLGAEAAGDAALDPAVAHQ